MSTTDPKSIKIVFFHLAFLYSGGGEKLALKQVELLRKSGYSVDCFSPLVDQNICFPDLIKKAQVKEIIPGLTKFFHAKPEVGVMIACILFPFLAFQYRKYDLVIGANQPGPIFGYILKLLFRIPYIIYIAQPTRILYKRPVDHELGLQIKHKMRFLPHIVNICRPFFYWIDLKSIISADIFLTNGKYMQGILSQIYGRVPIVCAPGAAVYLKNKVRSEDIFSIKNVQFSKPFLFMSNRHFPHKKFEHALEVLDLLDTKVPLIISGEPTEYTVELRRLVRYYRLDKWVHFLGYVTEKELHSLYQNCAVYIYTSPEEDFGMGIIEAMAHGKPVVAWNNAGPSKTITHQHDGFLAELENKQEMAKYISLCLENKNLSSKVGKNAGKTVKQKYSWNNHHNILHNAIQTILKAPYSTQTIKNDEIFFSKSIAS